MLLLSAIFPRCERDINLLKGLNCFLIIFCIFIQYLLVLLKYNKKLIQVETATKWVMN